MATTCKLIAKTTLGSNAASIEFTSIPGTYTDLMIAYSLRGASAGTGVSVRARFNGASTDTSHSSRTLYGDGSAAGSFSASYCHVGYVIADSAAASTFGSGEIYLPNYAGSTNKSYSAIGVGETNAVAVDMGTSAGLWSSTNAIDAIKIFINGMDLKSGSSAYLYGITKA